MKYSHEELLTLLEGQIFGGQPYFDIVDIAPDLALDDAYRLQFAMMKRRASQGDRVIGYKAAYTTLAIQKLHQMSSPLVGTLLQSAVIEGNKPIELTWTGRPLSNLKWRCCSVMSSPARA